MWTSKKLCSQVLLPTLHNYIIEPPIAYIEKGERQPGSSVSPNLHTFQIQEVERDSACESEPSITRLHIIMLDSHLRV